MYTNDFLCKPTVIVFSFFIMYILAIISETYSLSGKITFFFFQELAEKEQLAQEYKEYPAVLIKEAEIKNIVKLIDDPLLLKSTVSFFKKLCELLSIMMEKVEFKLQSASCVF